MTNEAAGNYIITADIQADGQLSLASALPTGGKGVHGLPGGGPDGLFSQGSVVNSAASGLVAVVNPGSNTISLFSADRNQPSQLTPVGGPVSSGGEFPVSLAFDGKGTTLCALNGGAANGVRCYTADPHAGLKPMLNTDRALGLNQTTPATGPPNTVSQILFVEDDKKLIVSVKGAPPTPGFYALWDVHANGLSHKHQRLAPPSGGLLPFSISPIPGTDAFLATDPGLGFEIVNLSGGGSKSSAVPIPGQVAACWSSYSPKTGNFYLVDVGAAIVTEVAVDKSLRGTIVKQYPQGKGTGIIDSEIASIGGTDYMYILAANATSIDVLSLEAPGQAKRIQTLGLMAPAKKAGITISECSCLLATYLCSRQFSGPKNLQGMSTLVKADY
ncbi:hypothetical protein FIBSPDRAFT_726282 [Athelia psychrophila]|uniref:Isomerase YbhE n=1 Tax=Athelia psychrophila TaxID=1759441 RepID=A0A166T0C5_9AGAM|nr:hypothetical protein FIBSPDRAFT_726282 [Fibularhizoctonia sp. CBS 109695]